MKKTIVMKFLTINEKLLFAVYAHIIMVAVDPTCGV